MKPQSSIVSPLIALLRESRLQPGDHLPAQMLADRLRVSRSPVNEALEHLHDAGLLTRVRHRGYFLAKDLAELPDDVAAAQGLDETDAVTAAYFRVADDLLRGELPPSFTESLMRARYGLTSTQLKAMLGRIAAEGWAQRRPGYGWEFSSMMTTPDSLLQSYRLRLALEPAALLEPGYRLAPAVIERCRAAERHLLDGGIDTDTADQLHERGVHFHESLVEASGNPYFIDTVKRVNRVRRLLSYRSMRDRRRYRQHCEQHLEVLDLLERERNVEASDAMRRHLTATLNNLGQITPLLQTTP